MVWTSTIHPDEVVIDDSNWREYSAAEFVVAGETKLRGLEPRDFDAAPYGSLEYAGRFPPEMLIDEDEWPARIEELERTGTRLSDLLTQANHRAKDQARTSGCWANTPAAAVEVLEILQQGGTDVDRISPASIIWPLKRRDVGGRNTEAVEFLAHHGGVPEDLWPPNAISPDYATEENDDERARHRVHEWNEARPRNERELISALLQPLPACLGINRLLHAVLGVDALYFGNGEYGVRFLNSWGVLFGFNGYGILRGSLHLADEILIPRTRTPN